MASKKCAFLDLAASMEIESASCMNENSSLFARLPEEIIEKILCYLWLRSDQNIGRQVCTLWNRLLLKIRLKRHKVFLQSVKNGKVYWKKYSNTSRVSPTPRFSHASCVLKGKLCVFGGCSSTNTVYNDFYVFCLAEQKWSKLSTRGFTPVPRECATLVGYCSSIILFGGCCQPPRSLMPSNGKFYNDVQILNLVDKHWTAISVDKAGSVNSPCPRAGHSASVVGNTMVIFGGAQSEKRFADVWCFNIESRTWHSPLTTGRKPLARFGPSQITINNQNILIMGGCGHANMMFSDVWLLNVGSWTWNEISVKNEIYAAPQLWSHPATMVDQTIVVFASPVSSTVTSAAVSLMTGLRQSLMQMYSLDCSKLETAYCCSWQPVVSNNKSIHATSLHSVSTCEDMIVIFGGLSDKQTVQTANNILVFVTPFWTE